MVPRFCAALGLAALCACGWRLGVPPAASAGYSAGEVSSQAAEPGLAAALEQALQSALGQGQGPALDVQLLQARARPVSDRGLIMELELVLQVQPRGAPQSALVLAGREPYTLTPNDPLATEQARAAAARALSQRLLDEAIWRLSQQESS